MAIYKRGRSWYIDIRLGGLRINRKVSESKTQAKEIEAELKTNYRLGRLNIEDIKRERHFSSVAMEYLEHVKDTLSELTYEGDKANYENHVLPFFKSIIIQDIDHSLLLDFQRSISSKGFSNRSVNIYMGLVRKIRRYAESKKYVSHDPGLEYPMLKEASKKHAFLSPPDFNKFIQNFDPKAEISRDRAIFARNTGMRPSELAFLSWYDTDFHLGVARVRSKEDLGFRVKDHEERDVPLNEEALAILKRRYKERKGPWVFSNTDDPVLSIDRALRTASKNAKIKKVTPNMLRHTFATHFLMAGGDLASLQKIMGHSSLETTSKYVGVVDEHMKASVEKIRKLDTFGDVGKMSESVGKRRRKRSKTKITN